MKQKLFSIVFATIISSILFVACKKDSTNPKEVDTTETSRFDINSVARTDNPATQHWEDAAGDCITPAVNCLPDVVVTPKFDALSAAIFNGTVQSFFNSGDADELMPYFGSEIFNKIANGTYTVIQHTNESTNTDFYFAGPSTGFLKENADVVIPVTN